MPKIFFREIISATAIIGGTLIGAICSYLIAKSTTNKSTKVQNEIFNESRKLEANIRKKNTCQYANILQLDICTAIFQSIRSIRNIQSNEVNKYPIYIPVNTQYSKAIAFLTDDFNLKEMSYLYQLYGIIEKINHDIKKLDYKNCRDYDSVRIDYEIFLEKLYGENMEIISKLDIDNGITYEDLIGNNFIKDGYKIVLEKLNKICNSFENK
ncbi:hypothetical protein CPAST_c28350 [Clostridium pasteurianum DSM 525 = ATCC 6013]|uniref:Uncharacterized protein n=2 Tax=Clostridium pasteurianum TaxID=1501 RepID=A0A0H3J4R4_CLOPA|nr:hypothetical protein [Clostridium pasteurianum]AJA48901.1 hypothetical protein CPAST_c28350 [Clostridium pasteurianum DSM 525 = ATCC 6013]AJA52889.1 hypothetical protein CLPA_c28350 [Clostridium pasteurianum DSM 525 = ATCC 6013]AOZ76110.1 hypothetical protein AQ983_13770 [Clostridium pasteurianum DSM 525 = ATCC 6013]AOZ79906.1 hypothetical protein AQ984_13765 [Clostridium pasteurianum]ELP60197.1 hypothetical protein F502_06157 [Clostridium pasteurianum DSM 525 = ATCC 6013]